MADHSRGRPALSPIVVPENSLDKSQGRVPRDEGPPDWRSSQQSQSRNSIILGRQHTPEERTRLAREYNQSLLARSPAGAPESLGASGTGNYEAGRSRTSKPVPFRTSKSIASDNTAGIVQELTTCLSSFAATISQQVRDQIRQEMPNASLERRPQSTTKDRSYPIREPATAASQASSSGWPDGKPAKNARLLPVAADDELEACIARTVRSLTNLITSEVSPGLVANQKAAIRRNEDDIRDMRSTVHRLQNDHNRFFTTMGIETKQISAAFRDVRTDLADVRTASLSANMKASEDLSKEVGDMKVKVEKMSGRLDHIPKQQLAFSKLAQDVQTLVADVNVLKALVQEQKEKLLDTTQLNSVESRLLDLENSLSNLNTVPEDSGQTLGSSEAAKNTPLAENPSSAACATCTETAANHEALGYPLRDVETKMQEYIEGRSQVDSRHDEDIQSLVTKTQDMDIAVHDITTSFHERLNEIGSIVNQNADELRNDIQKLVGIVASYSEKVDDASALEKDSQVVPRVQSDIVLVETDVSNNPDIELRYDQQMSVRLVALREDIMGHLEARSLALEMATQNLDARFQNLSTADLSKHILARLETLYPRSRDLENVLVSHTNQLSQHFQNHTYLDDFVRQLAVSHKKSAQLIEQLRVRLSADSSKASSQTARHHHPKQQSMDHTIDQMAVLEEQQQVLATRLDAISTDLVSSKQAFTETNGNHTNNATSLKESIDTQRLELQVMRQDMSDIEETMSDLRGRIDVSDTTVRKELDAFQISLQAMGCQHPPMPIKPLRIMAPSQASLSKAQSRQPELEEYDAMGVASDTTDLGSPFSPITRDKRSSPPATEESDEDVPLMKRRRRR